MFRRTGNLGIQLSQPSLTHISSHKNAKIFLPKPQWAGSLCLGDRVLLLVLSLVLPWERCAEYALWFRVPAFGFVIWESMLSGSLVQVLSIDKT